MLKLFTLSNGALLVALSLSTIAAWYSIIGLTAIFAGAVIPIIIMGSALELAKITTTVWLRKYWHRCGILYKMYLVPAVVLLALLTSMGIFGFLSKAHLDQNVGSGDVQAKVSLLDEKIATQRENIKASKAALAQMDAQVNDIMTKGDSERAVERSVVIRKQQQKERANLLKDIEIANQEIQKLNEERAPIASELRKVEAEVGPIKYIAALIYGDTADHNTLEAAVRWVIILLVIVFDPLAIMLVLAANQSKEWDQNIDEESKLKEQIEHEKVMAEFESEKPDAWVADVGEKPTAEELVTDPITFNDPGEHPKDDLQYEEPEPEPEKSVFEKHPYLNEPFVHFTNTTPIVHKPESDTVEETVLPEDEVVAKEPLFETIEIPETVTGTADGTITADQMIAIPDVERPGDYVTPNNDEINGVGGKRVHGTSGIKHTNEDEYVLFEGKKMRMGALKGLRPDLFGMAEDGIRMPKTEFGTSFPSIAIQGDTFVRVDTIPNRVFKFNGTNWIETARENSDAYLSNTNYLQYLVDKLGSGEYDPELLTEAEQDAIKEHISGKNA
jgi:hypothetical protein